MNRLNLVKNEILVAAALSLFSMIMLAYRLFITEKIIFLFLTWNLFLAWLPLIFALIVFFYKQNKILVVLFTILFVLFLPNASYMITDIAHIKYSPGKLIWLDLIMITCFAISGLMLFYTSIRIVLNSFEIDIKRYYFFSFIIILISSYGVFIGRFLRFNSWDVISKPLTLIAGVGDALADIDTHLFALAFAVMLFLLKIYIGTYNKPGLDEKF